MFTKKKPKKKSYLQLFIMQRSCKAFIRVYLSPTLVAGKRRHTVHPPKEGMCLAGYGMLGVGKIKGGEIKAKSSWVNSQGLKFLRSKYALSHTIPLSVNS